MAVLVVWGVSGQNVTVHTPGSGRVPRPQKSVTYPIVFPKTDRAPRPQKSVTYPIVFPSSGSQR
ncbi:hypothetical protein [Streptomyces sp. NPDC005408]|uniref:hypothetical protein n=1 Tax=Streptomyces sp. NPDC005408 TaxID=3155341 RepID=UPI0033A60D2D